MSKISRRSLAAFVAAIAFAVAGFAAPHAQAQQKPVIKVSSLTLPVFNPLVWNIMKAKGFDAKNGFELKLLADIHVAQWPKSKHRLLREAIQWTLQSNKPDPRLKDPASKPSRKKKASSV
jgi:hypothetical protein